MNEERRQELTEQFREEVHLPAMEDAKGEEILYDTNFHGLTIGWAMAKGESIPDAYEFATYIRYHTDLG